jgi:hypothetical protein
MVSGKTLALVHRLHHRIASAEEVIDQLVDRVFCPRCTTDPPLDEWRADARAPHTCGKEPYAP